MLDLSVLDSAKAEVESLALEQAELANKEIKEMTQKFKDLELESVWYGWYTPAYEGAEEYGHYVDEAIGWDRKEQKIVYQFGDSEEHAQEVVAGMSMKSRASLRQHFSKLIERAVEEIKKEKKLYGGKNA